MIYKCIKNFHVGYMIHEPGTWWEKIGKNTLMNIATGTVVTVSDLELKTRFEKYERKI